MIHFHKYEEVDRQDMVMDEYSIFTKISSGVPVTLITYKCTKCQKYKQEILKGWIGK